jgi:hypothetical protein
VLPTGCACLLLLGCCGRQLDEVYLQLLHTQSNMCCAGGLAPYQSDSTLSSPLTDMCMRGTLSFKPSTLRMSECAYCCRCHSPLLTLSSLRAERLALRILCCT